MGNCLSDFGITITHEPDGVYDISYNTKRDIDTSNYDATKLEEGKYSPNNEVVETPSTPQNMTKMPIMPFFPIITQFIGEILHPSERNANQIIHGMSAIV